MQKHHSSTPSRSRKNIYCNFKVYISRWESGSQKKTHTEKMRGGIARGRPSASAGAVQQGYPERDAVWYIQQCDAFDEVPFI